MIGESNPIFVKIDKYKEIIDIIQVIDKKISNVKQTLAELDELRQKEDKEMMNWDKSVEEISHKLASIKDDITGE